MAYKPNYRPDSNVFRTSRAQNPHDIISMHSGSEEAQRQARFAHIQALLQDAIRDEEDAIRKYTHLLEELNKYIGDFGAASHYQGVYTPAGSYAELEIITYIRDQEVNHRALLEKLRR